MNFVKKNRTQKGKTKIKPKIPPDIYDRKVKSPSMDMDDTDREHSFLQTQQQDWSEILPLELRENAIRSYFRIIIFFTDEKLPAFIR